MGKIDELIQRYCPDGVEYVKLDEMGSFYSGLSGKSKEDFRDGNAKFITYVNIFNNPALNTDVEDKVKIADGEKQNTIQYGDLLFTGSSETPDECGMCSVLTHHTDENLYLNSFCFGFRFNDLSDKCPSFMKHLFRSTSIRKRICKTANGVTRYNISKKEFAKIEIPLPPLPVQEEIVRILDNFTNLAAELQAELQARQQQYNYYRDDIIRQYSEGAEYVPLSELGTFYSGLSGKSKDDFKDGNAKFITYVNIFNNPSLKIDVEEKVKIADGEKQNTVQYGDLLFTGSSETPDECGMCSVLTHHTDEQLYLNSFCFGFRFNDMTDKNPDFMKHLFRCSSIRKAICKTANGVTRYNVSKKEFAKIKIPIISLDAQEKVAAILDKFFTLSSDLSQGLPAEIEARRQQYEYYRDKLLTFKKKA